MSTSADTLFPYTALFRSEAGGVGVASRRLGPRRREPGLPPGLVRDLGEGVAAEAGDEVDLGAQPSGSHGLVGALAARAQHKLPPEDRLAQPRLARCAIGGIGDEDTEDDAGLVAGLAGAERGHAASGGRISSAGVLYRLPQRPNPDRKAVG